MERTKEKDFLKDRILKDLQIILWGIVALLCAVCLVLECLPSESSGITVKEPVEVSSALINKTQNMRFTTVCNYAFLVILNLIL